MLYARDNGGAHAKAQLVEFERLIERAKALEARIKALEERRTR